MLEEYFLFLLKTFTVFAGIIVTILACKNQEEDPDLQKISIKDYSNLFLSIQKLIDKATNNKKTKKVSKKKLPNKIFCIKFKGDLKASRTKQLSIEISSIIQSADPKKDKVILDLESPGGCVHGYGHAAAELMRLKKAGIPFDVVINQVAASGGYMMACIADNIIAAPFAIVGSIGVVMQVPNVYKLLKNNSIEYEQLTAGQYKRTIGVFTENTDKDRAKAQEQIEETHKLFKDFVAENRPSVDIEKIATGEYWHAKQAIELSLIDEIATSEEYIQGFINTHKIYKISAASKPKLLNKLTSQISYSIENAINKIFNTPPTQNMH